jgi:ABC-type maltose transport system permease subunit
MNWQRFLPTLASILIILVITALRDRSRILAGIIAVTPINIPLALWIVSGATGDDSTQLAHFTWGLLLGLIPVFLWVLVAFLAFRFGWSLWIAIGLAYLAWAVLLGLGFAVGWLSFK